MDHIRRRHPNYLHRRHLVELIEEIASANKKAGSHGKKQIDTK